MAMWDTTFQTLASNQKVNRFMCIHFNNNVLMTEMKGLKIDMHANTEDFQFEAKLFYKQISIKEIIISGRFCYNSPQYKAIWTDWILPTMTSKDNRYSPEIPQAVSFSNVMLIDIIAMQSFKPSHPGIVTKKCICLYWSNVNKLEFNHCQ